MSNERNLFKYTKIKYLIPAIQNGIYAGRLIDFNDPYEYEGIRYPNAYRVCCLSKVYNSILMWGYYCNNRGCCIEFEVDDNNEIKDVQYVVEYQNHADLTEEQLLDNLYFKGIEWKHENEVRIIYNSNTNNNVSWQEVNQDIYYKANVKRIFFGIRTDFNDNNVQQILKYMRDYNSNKLKKDQIQVKLLKLSDTRYQYIIDPQFDYLQEILD